MTTEQAAHQMELVTEFLESDREERQIPGPYEQGANQIRRDTLSDLFAPFD